MKQTEIPIGEARTRLAEISQAFERNPKKRPLRITKRGKPTLTVMSCELYDSLMETMEILSDRELMKDIRKAEREIEEGRSVEWNEIRKEFG